MTRIAHKNEQRFTKAKQNAQGLSVSSSARRNQKAQHHVVGIKAAAICDSAFKRETSSLERKRKEKKDKKEENKLYWLREHIQRRETDRRSDEQRQHDPKIRQTTPRIGKVGVAQSKAKGNNRRASEEAIGAS